MSNSPFLSHPKMRNSDYVLQGLRVLVVDDDIDSCDLIAMTLESFAAETQAVFSTQQAVEIFRQFQPDVLVSDIAMPDEDGYALIRQVRALEGDRGRLTPAIAVTALVNEEEEMDQRLLAAGFQQWLPKPLDLEALVEAVETLTGRY